MLRLATVACLAAIVCARMPAQAPVRIVRAVHLDQTVRLQGNTVWRRHRVVDRGAAPPDLPLNHMLLLLRRSPQQEATLQELLAAQREQGSRDYHRWLTPEQFGARFGPSPQDITTVEQWLAAQGFNVLRFSPGGLVIEFSGVAADVQHGLHTPIRRYQTATGASFWANADDPAIPAALAPVVAGVVSLNSFRARPLRRLIGQGTAAGPLQLRALGEPVPQLNFTANGVTQRALVPGDFATIYNVNPLFNRGLTGSGQTIAIVARSDIDPNDLAQFRALFQPRAPTNVLTTMQAGGSDPGIATNGDQQEATLDVEWAGAAAPSAKLDLVVAAGSATTDGVDLSALYIVDHNLAPIVNTSFGSCETQMGATENQFWNNLWEEAAAQGMTVLVSAGDNGPAGCDDPDAAAAQNGLAVSGLASTPYDTAVGGSEFHEGSNDAADWSASAKTDYSSALGYIPEQPWNEAGEDTGGGGLWSGGGGASLIYNRPFWQVGTGVPAVNARLLPDVALSAAAHDGYVVCYQGSCQTSGSNSQFNFYVFSGTSAAAPALAGIMALVDQDRGSSQGLANPILYRLAATQAPGSCDSSDSPAGSCAIYDITQGNNFVPCAPGSPDCGPNEHIGFSAGPGYDEASGLGSVNAGNLVNLWGSIGFAASNTALALTPPANASVGASVPISISVTAAPAGGSSAPSSSPSVPPSAAPTGAVELIAYFSDGAQQWIENFSLGSGGAVQASTTALPGGSYTVVASYSGDANYGPSLSTPVAVTLTKSTATVTLQIFAGGQSPVSSVIYGANLQLLATVHGAAGTALATGTVTFSASQPGNIGSAPLGSTGSSYLAYGFTQDVGTYTVQAHYGGDNSYAAADSAPVTLTVTPSPTSIQISQGEIIGSGFGSQRLNVTLATQSQAALFSGGIFLVFNDSTQIDRTGIGGDVGPNAAGIQQFTGEYIVPILPGTSAAISIQYTGNKNFLPSTSNTLTVPTPANTVLSPSSLVFGTYEYGQTSPPQTITITNQGGLPAYLSFSDPPNYTQTTTCGASLASLATCTAALTLAPTLSTYGPYASGLFWDGVSRQNVKVTGTVRAFQLYLGGGGNFLIKAGGSEVVPIAAKPSGGFTGPVTFRCSELPAGANCVFSPPSVTLDGTDIATTTVTITTTAPTAPPVPSSDFALPPPPTGRPSPGLLLGLAAIAGALALGSARSRRRRPAAMGWLTLVFLLAAGCGGGAAGGAPPPYAGGGGSTGGSTDSNTPPPPSFAQMWVSPMNLQIVPPVPVGQTSAPATLTARNSGTAPVQISGINFGGAQAGDFHQINTCGSSIAVNSSCTISVTFAPSFYGQETATLTVAANAENGNPTVQLTGWGQSGTPAGGYSVIVHGSSPGQPDITASVPLNVSN